MSSIFQFSNVTFLYEMFRTAFGGIEWFLIAYFVCLAGFFVIGKERLSLGFLYPFLFMLLTIFNPFFSVPHRGKDRPDHPDSPPVLAASGQSRARLCLYHALYSPHEKWAQLLLSIVFAVFVATVGSSVRPYLHMPQNIYKTSDEILEISPSLNRILPQPDWKSAYSTQASSCWSFDSTIRRSVVSCAATICLTGALIRTMRHRSQM